LNAKNKIATIRALAFPVLRNNFGIIFCRLGEKIDRKTRKFLTMYKMPHPIADIGRLYVYKRNGGGRSLLQIEATCKREVKKIFSEYLNTNFKEGEFVNIVKINESNQSNMNSAIKTPAVYRRIKPIKFKQ
jgi:hypothetical protein